MNLKKTTVILLALFFIAGCGGKNYSGDYVYLINTQKAYYVTETGAEIDPDSALGSGALFLGAMSSHKQNYRKAYKYELTKAILTLKQEGITVDGKLILTNDKSLTEFIIKSGYIDNDKRLHLKLTYQPEATLGMSAGFLSMSGPLGKL